jgi:uncharacterized protein (TIGR03435 family)
MRSVALLLLGIFADQAPAAAQTAALTFEVASVKRSTSNSQSIPFEVTTNGGFNANISLEFLIQAAYNIKPFQLIDAPGWTRSETYTIAAKPPAGTVSKHPNRVDADLQERLRSLLEERFHLVARREKRELPAYELVVAKGGPKVKEVGEGNFKLRLGRGRIANDGGASIAMLTSLLTNNLDRAVFDATGLAGFYKFDLTWTPDNQPDGTGPSLFTALQEQLGLKLEAKRRAVDVVVVERVERPSEN